VTRSGAFEWLARAGFAARGVVYKAVGLDGALAQLDHASYGPFLLGIVAAGLVAFGVYSLSDARYRRI
jgi:hypothetical protein